MATSYLKTLRLFGRDVRLYLITAALVGFCWMGAYIVLFNLYLLRLGYGPEFIGLMGAAGMLAYALFSLPAGALGGLWGIRRAMVLGWILGVAGLALPLLAEFIPATLREGWLLVTYALGYLGAVLYIVNADVFLVEATSPTERGHVFSMQVALWPLAGFAGSLAGGLLPGLFASTLGLPLDHPAPYRWSLLTTAAVFVPGVPALLAMRAAGGTRARETISRAGSAPYALIALLALVQLLQGAGEGTARTFFNVYLDAGLGAPTYQIGTLAAVSQLLAVPVALATPLVMARWGNFRTFTWASLGIALSLLPLALIPHWGAAGLGFVGVMALASVWKPAFVLYRMELVSPGWRAVLNGAANMALGLSMSAMSLGGGYIVTGLGYPSLFLTGASVTVAGALLFWVYFRVPRGELANPPVVEGAASQAEVC